MNKRFFPLIDTFRVPAFESEEKEKAYWKQEDKGKLAQRKFFLLMGIFVFATIGILDALTAGDSAIVLMQLRMFAVALLILFYYRFAKENSPERRDKILFMFGLIIAVTMVVMIVIAPLPAADFYPFLISATMVFAGSLVVPRFSTMAKLCIIANLLYWPTVPFSQTSLSAIYMNAFILTVTSFAVTVGAFAREKLEREQAMFQAQLAEAREEAIMSRDTAIQASHAKSHLLANVSHELRTPMNAILGFSEVMKSEIFGRIPQEQYREYVNDIHFAGTLLQANINDLLDVSRLEVDKMGWTDTWSELTEIIDHTVTTCQRDTRNAQVRLTADVDDRNVVIFCDLERTAQILINLVTNAVKFSDAGTEITISAETRKDCTILSVTDQGCGIAPEHIEQIFEPFRQVDSDSLTTQKGGMGLGLSIVQALVKKLDGRLAIDSEVGRGTTVTVEIPAARVRPSAPPMPANAPTERTPSRAAG
jgi:signal transduction histidine kinase